MDNPHPPVHQPPLGAAAKTLPILRLADATVVACDPAAAELLGRHLETIAGHPVIELSPRQQADGSPSGEALARRIQAARAGLPQTFRWCFLSDTGNSRECVVELSAHDGEQLEARLQPLWSTTPVPAEHFLWRQLLDQSQAAVYAKDAGGRYRFVNRHFLTLSGLAEAEVLNRRDEELFPPAVAASFLRHDRLVRQTGMPRTDEERFDHAHGQQIFLSHKFPLHLPGEVDGIGGFSTDITDRKRMEQVFQDTAMVVSRTGGEGVFRDLVCHLGWVLGVKLAMVAELQERPGGTWLRTLDACLDGQVIDNFEYPLACTPCQQVIDHCQDLTVTTGVAQRFPEDALLKQFGYDSYAAYPLLDREGQPRGLVAVLHDRALTDTAMLDPLLKLSSLRAAAELERHRAEAQQRSLESSYRAVFDASLDGLLLWHPAGRISEANPACCALFGYGREALLALEPQHLFAPESALSYARFPVALRAGEPFHTEIQARRCDGSRFHAELHGVRTVYHDEPHLLAVIRDISTRQQAEAERQHLEDQLRQAQKMEAIGHLTGGIAHDFNNILTTILGYATLAEESLDNPPASLARYLGQIQQASNRARDLIRQLLTFSRGQQGEQQTLALPLLIKEAMRLFASTFPATLSVHTALDPATRPVRANPVQIEQVLMNLCINARDAMDGEGVLEVSVRDRGHLEVRCQACRETARGEFVELAVSDTGSGIAPAQLERIFEPFFTTKAPGKGSGMGLATTHGIVHDCGGHILVETGPGTGTVFRILLPPDAAPSTGAPETQPTPTGFTRFSGEVLVVDDERSVADFMAELLETRGLRVTTAADGAEALTRFQTDPARFSLVIADQTMPKLTGLQLTRELRGQRPDLPVILYSGHSEDLDEQRVLDSGAAAFLRKPVDLTALFSTIARLWGEQKS